MSDRVNEHRQFLENLQSHRLSKDRKQILKSASNEQLKTLFEIFENLRNVTLLHEEEKYLCRYKAIILKFFTKTWSLTSFRKYIISYDKVMCIIVTVVLKKIVDSIVCNILANSL